MTTRSLPLKTTTSLFLVAVENNSAIPNHNLQFVILNFLLLSTKPNHSNLKQIMTHLYFPQTKPNQQNSKSISHKLDVVVDPTSPSHCYQEDLSPSITPFPLLIVEITREEKRKTEKQICE
jgi:hypothetical protein